jgi:hypothetical protein
MAQCDVHALKGLVCLARATRLARLPRAASSAQRSRRLRSTRAAASGLLAHAEVTKYLIFFQWTQNVGTLRQRAPSTLTPCEALRVKCGWITPVSRQIRVHFI